MCVCVCVCVCVSPVWTLTSVPGPLQAMCRCAYQLVQCLEGFSHLAKHSLCIHQRTCIAKA